MNSNIETIMRAGPVIPVIVIERQEDALPLAKALYAGGIRVLEITLRTSAALHAIKIIADYAEENWPDMWVGAGTVRTPFEAEQVQKAGSSFAISPGYYSALGRACQDLELDLLPGVATGSEVMQAYFDGYRFLKFFPAAAAGSSTMIKAFAGPFFDVKFCPTGGISIINAPEFLALPNVLCVGGSWLTPEKLITNHDWDGITALAKTSLQLKNQPA